MNRRFWAAMAIYAMLAALAWITLTGVIRTATWLVLGAIALKTYLSVLRDRID